MINYCVACIGQTIIFHLSYLEPNRVLRIESIVDVAAHKSVLCLSRFAFIPTSKPTNRLDMIFLRFQIVVYSRHYERFVYLSTTTTAAAQTQASAMAKSEIIFFCLCQNYRWHTTLRTFYNSQPHGSDRLYYMPLLAVSHSQ